jgi:hypothetical protein
MTHSELGCSCCAFTRPRLNRRAVGGRRPEPPQSTHSRRSASASRQKPRTLAEAVSKPNAGLAALDTSREEGERHRFLNREAAGRDQRQRPAYDESESSCTRPFTCTLSKRTPARTGMTTAVKRTIHIGSLRRWWNWCFPSRLAVGRMGNRYGSMFLEIICGPKTNWGCFLLQIATKPSAASRRATERPTDLRRSNRGAKSAAKSNGWGTRIRT